MSDSVRPHRWQPTRLSHSWDSPGKNTGVGCHFLLQCMKVKSESEVTQLCPTLGDSMDCSLPGSSVHRIFQARVLEWGAIAFSMNEVQNRGFCHCWRKDHGEVYLPPPQSEMYSFGTVIREAVLTKRGFSLWRLSLVYLQVYNSRSKDCQSFLFLKG